MTDNLKDKSLKNASLFYTELVKVLKEKNLPKGELHKLNVHATHLHGKRGGDSA